MNRRGPAAGFALLLALTAAAVAVPALTKLGSSSDRRPWRQLTLPGVVGSPEPCARLAPNRVDPRVHLEIGFVDDESPAEPRPEDWRTAVWTGRNLSSRGVPTLQGGRVLVLRPGTDEVVGEAWVVGGIRAVPPLAPGGEVRQRIYVDVLSCDRFGLRGRGGDLYLDSRLPPGDYDALPISQIVQSNAEPIYASIIGARTRFTIKGPPRDLGPVPRPCQPSEGALGMAGTGPPGPTPLAFPYPQDPRSETIDVTVGIVPLHLQDQPCRLRTEAVLRLPCGRTSTYEYRFTVEADLPADHMRVVHVVSSPRRCLRNRAREMQLVHNGGVSAELPPAMAVAG